MGRLFGTDGIRGIANRELTAELALNLGRIVAELLEGGQLLLARDTRVSGDMLECALGAGLMSGGRDFVVLGVLPTPAVPYLVLKNRAAAGIMITASHNPGEYNGIKIFGPDGRKLPDTLEDEIESRLLHGLLRIFSSGNPTKNEEKSNAPFGVAERKNYPNAADEYLQFLLSGIDTSLDGLSVALDCANGAAAITARMVFEKLGAKVHLIGESLDGYNINKNCGSLHPETLQRLVVEKSLDVGFAFDGDADRVLAVDERGRLIDGDMILSICALDMKKRGILAKNTLVATVMSNFGLGVFCKKNGIELRTTRVGDRWVLEELLSGGLSLGGEQSGHIIFSEHSTAGDGQLTALQIAQIMQRRGKALSELAGVMEHYPQVLKNISVSQLGKLRLSDDLEIQSAVEQAQKLLGGDGRVLLRASGTEPLLRLMVEGRDAAVIETIASELKELVEKQLL